MEKKLSFTEFKVGKNLIFYLIKMNDFMNCEEFHISRINNLTFKHAYTHTENEREKHTHTILAIECFYVK